MRRSLASVAIVATLASMLLGSAAMLDVSPAALSAGRATVTDCDEDGIDVGYRLAWAGHVAVERVDVSGIADACIGLELTMVLIVAGTPVVVGVTPVPRTEPDDNAVTLAVPTDVPAADVESVHVAIT